MRKINMINPKNPQFVQTSVSGRIFFEYYNSFTKQSLGDVLMPFDRIKSTNGYYSRWWKMWRPFLAKQYNLDIHWVRLRVSFR